MQPDAIKLLRKFMSDNRQVEARRIQEQRDLEDSRQQFTGTFLGKNADGGSGLVQIDGGGVVPCEITAGRLLKSGQSVLVTLPAGSSQGFVDGI